MSIGRKADYKRIVREPFARPGTFADGWNDACARIYPDVLGEDDYSLGHQEAIRLGAGRQDAFNMVEPVR